MLISKNGGQYLDITKINFLAETTVKAYVVRALPRLDVNLQPYIIFTLRDVNVKTIRAMMFQVNNTETLGYDLPQLKNRVVEIKYVADNKFGGISLKINDLKVLDDPSEHKNFSASYQPAEQEYRIYKSTLAEHGIETVLSAEAVHSIVNKLGNGSVGIYMKFASMVLDGIKNKCRLTGVDTKPLLECADRVIEGYRKFLGVEERGLGHLIMETLKLSATEAKSATSPENNNIIVETLNCLYNGYSPQHLYAHILVKEIRGTLNLFQLSEAYPSVFPGQVTKVGDEQLAKY